MRYEWQWLGRETILSISQKSTKARVANHNGFDAKLLRRLRSSLQTTKAWVANHNGPDAKLLRMSLAACAYVFALLVAVKIQLHMLAAEQHGHPCTFWNVPLACTATRAHFWGCGPACFLPSFTAYPGCMYIYLYYREYIPINVCFFNDIYVYIDIFIFIFIYDDNVYTGKW